MNRPATFVHCLSAAWLVAVVCSGCSLSRGPTSPVDGGTDGARCPSVAACGGTIAAGSYTITSSCDDGMVTPVPADGVCQGGTQSSDIELRGTFWFDGTITYNIDATETFRNLLYLPASCLSKFGVNSCSEMAQKITFDPTALVHATVTCAGTSTCTCTTLGTQAVLEQGAYATSGTNLTLASFDNPQNSFFSYCVSGNQITMSSTDTTTSTTTIVLERQDSTSAPLDGSVMTDVMVLSCSNPVRWCSFRMNSPSGVGFAGTQ